MDAVDLGIVKLQDCAGFFTVRPSTCGVKKQLKFSGMNRASWRGKVPVSSALSWLSGRSWPLLRGLRDYNRDRLEQYATSAMIYIFITYIFQGILRPVIHLSCDDHNFLMWPVRIVRHQPPETTI